MARRSAYSVRDPSIPFPHMCAFTVKEESSESESDYEEDEFEEEDEGGEEEEV